MNMIAIIVFMYRFERELCVLLMCQITIGSIRFGTVDFRSGRVLRKEEGVQGRAVWTSGHHTFPVSFDS